MKGEKMNEKDAPVGVGVGVGGARSNNSFSSRKTAIIFIRQYGEMGDA